MFPCYKQDFEYATPDEGKSLFNATDLSSVEFSPNYTDLQKADKMSLQNYGRPYANGKPTGTFYKFAKKPPLTSLAEVAAEAVVERRLSMK